MLYNLKKAIRNEQNAEYVAEAVSHAADDSVKGVFLDSLDAQVIGAENDPEIEKLIKEIPEYDDEKEQKELEAQLESFIPETEF